MGFLVFLLVTATLLVRPAEQLPELASIHIYEVLILLCFALSFNGILAQFSLHNLETRPISICTFGLLLAVVLSHVSQGNATAASDSATEFFKILVYYVLLVGNLTTAYRLRVFLMCFGFFGAACALVAVLQYHGEIELPVPERTAQDALKAKQDTGEAFVKDVEYDPVTGQMVEFKRLRGTGTFRDPNDLSLLLNSGVFIALYCWTNRQLGAMRWPWLVFLGFFLYSLSLTHSRGGLLGMLAGFMALFYVRFGWRNTLLLSLALVPAALATVGGRMASFSTSDGTSQTRIQTWSDCFAELLTAPLFGIGLGELGTHVGKAAHNSFLSAFAELGLFGGTLFFGAFFFALGALLKMVKNRRSLVDPDLSHLLPFLTAILASYSVGILSLSRFDAVPTYLLLGLVTVTINLAAVYIPSLVLRFDTRLIRRMAVASAIFLAVAYSFVRVFKV